MRILHSLGNPRSHQQNSIFLSQEVSAMHPSEASCVSHAARERGVRSRLPKYKYTRHACNLILAGGRAPRTAEAKHSVAA